MAVAHGAEGGERRGADTLGGRVRGDQRGIGLLQLLETAEERIVLGIRDLGCVEHVIAMIVIRDGATQLGQLVPDVARGP